MDALTISVILLWLAVLAMAVMLWALSRQVGVLFERVAPMGALVTDAGPAVGTASPRFDLQGIQSEPVRLGQATERATLVFFLAPAPIPATPPREIGGRVGPEPTRYGDWERKGIAVDF